MQIRFLVLGAVVLSLVPFSARAQNPEGQYGFKDLEPLAQQEQMDSYYGRIQNGLQKHGIYNYEKFGNNSPFREGDAIHQYQSWNPNDKPDKWRYNQKGYGDNYHMNRRPKKPEASEADDD